MIPMQAGRRSSSNVNLSNIKTESQRRLFGLLDKYEGTKTIIFDDKLIGPFEFVASASLLKQHDATRLFRLSDIKLGVFNEIRTEYILIFMRKDYHVAKHLAEILQRSDRVTLSKTSLVFVPYRCASIERLLEQNKVDLFKLGSLEQLKLHLFVLDTDILSTENEHAYRDLYLNNDHSFARQIADGLIQLQEFCGQIPRISGQGKGAKIVCDLLTKYRKLHACPMSNTDRDERVPQIQHLVLIDRQIDLVTPFLTQLTYEGLLDEVFGINHGTITLPGDKFVQNDDANSQKEKDSTKKSPVETKRFELKSSEDLFARLRDCHTNAVANVLKQSAKTLQAEYEECRREGKTIVEIGKIVKRLNNLKVAEKSQSIHVAMAELINEQTLRAEFIYGLRIEHELLQEDRVNRVYPEIDMKLLRQEHPLHVLRLICLQSIVSNGFKQKVCDHYKREIVQNYGPSFIPFLILLERAKVLLSHERFYEVGGFTQLNNKMILVRDDVDECNPNHFSYVYGGYSPISIAVTRILVNSTQSPIWRSQSDNLKLLPEPTVNYIEPQQPLTGALSSSSDFLQPVTGNTVSLTSNAVNAANAAASIFLTSATSGGARARRHSATSSQSSSEETKTVLVFFVGGCTFAEISALRFLSQQEENNCEFLIGTTKIINGRSFLSSLWPLANDLVPQ